MWLLADAMVELNEHLANETHVLPPIVVKVVGSCLTLIYFAFLLWMLAHCYLNEPDRFFWIWIMILAQIIGPVAYFLLRYLPSREFPTPAFLRKWTRGRELARLETAAEQIGNAHQFVQWGNALREVGQLDQARKAYERALKKDAANLQALWGAAQIATSQKRFPDALDLTRRVLDRDPQYKFGDVSLAHARALNQLGRADDARGHLEEHVRRWRHPEALYLLASLYAKRGDVTLARQHLNGLIQDINGCPAGIARKFGRWKSLARQLQRKLPASPTA